MSDSVSKSWFCVFNNPEEHGYSGNPEQIIETLKEEWVSGHPTRSGAWTYCISAEGLRHIHMVLEDTKAMRFTAIKNTYAVGMHFEPTKGTKDQAEDYINKRGKWDEKGEKVISSLRYGEIKGAQGSRRDLSIIDELLEQGLSPDEIFMQDTGLLRYEKMVRNKYWLLLVDKTPIKREIVVYWHIGESGTGKSYTCTDLVRRYGRNKVYIVSDYDTGYLDTYGGQPILFLDEFRGNIRFSTFLTMLGGYTTEIHARYSNVYMVWTEVHITSIMTPFEIYKNMFRDSEEQNNEPYEQLKRRISYMVYHWKDERGYHSYQMSMAEYKDRFQLESVSKDAFITLPAITEQLSFNNI